MTGLVSWVALGLITAFIAPLFIPEQFRRWQFEYGVRVLGALLILFGIFSTSYAHVGDGKFAQLFRVYGGGSLTGGKIVAVDGENGPQARILRPGFQVSLLLNVLYDVDTTKAETEIPDGKVGVLTAKDVPTGFVGVVKSNVWAEVDFGTLRADKPTNCDVISNKDKSEGRLEAPIVPVGCVGVWKDFVATGKILLQSGRVFDHRDRHAGAGVDLRRWLRPLHDLARGRFQGRDHPEARL